MSLKDRIKKLEQSQGIDVPHKLIIVNVYNARREATDAEVEALKKTLKGDSLVLWNGERFFTSLDDYMEADNPLTEAELAERKDNVLLSERGEL
jgi:hypothetical protein